MALSPPCEHLCLAPASIAWHLLCIWLGLDPALPLGVSGPFVASVWPGSLLTFN